MSKDSTASRETLSAAAAKTREERREAALSLAFMSPLMIFMALVFVIPLISLLTRAVWVPDVAHGLPQTSKALLTWQSAQLPGQDAFEALSRDLSEARRGGALGRLAQRLNFESPGFQSLLYRTERYIAKPAFRSQLEQSTARDLLIHFDKRWGDIDYWRIIARTAKPFTWSYLLRALDMELRPDGSIQKVPADQAVFLPILERTFGISLVTTLWALALGFPLAYWLTRLSPAKRNLALILILIPFWSSMLVRVAAWMVLLQRTGLVNRSLIDLHLIAQPIDLLFNRVGVYVSMVHILLPVMVFPIFNAMQSVPDIYRKAAMSLGSHPIGAFWRILVPLTAPGITAGCLLVFIMALGYYIAPMLLGGASDQMLSYYVAYFTNESLNWPLACALGTVLLLSTAIVFIAFGALTRIFKIKAFRI